MDKEDVVIVGIVGVVMAVVIALIVVPFVGIRINTGSGQHTGYVTAIEKNGLIWKTWRAYVKTDTQSSQEDTYCVIDPSVVAQLTRAVDTKEHVTVSYFSWVSAGITKCSHEGAIINAVTATP